MNQKTSFPRQFKLAAAAVSLAVLSGCASVNFDQSLTNTNEAAADFTQGKLTLA